MLSHRRGIRQSSQRMVCSLWLLLLAGATFAQTEFDLGTAKLSINARGYAQVAPVDAEPWPMGSEPILQLDTGQGRLAPDSVTRNEDRLTAKFPGDAICELTVRTDQGFAVFEVTRLDAPQPATRLGLFSLALPPKAAVMGTLNAGRTATHIATLSAAEPNVHAFMQSLGRNDADRAGCSHEFVPTDDVQSGATAARFTATSDAATGGWSVCGRAFRQPLDLTGCKAIRAWVRGDAKGEALKIQLYDGQGGYRDTYIPISFEGWQQVTIDKPALDTLRYDHVATLSLYYNSLPPSQTVSCVIDRIEAIIERDAKEETVLLEDFESPGSIFWSEATQTLNLETLALHGVLPARFGLIVCPEDAFADTMARFEVAAGLPSPRPGGVWNKQSPWIKRSYLFITNFSEPQFDDVLAMARRGGFDTLLILQSSWTKATGHFEVNTTNFPDGLDGLVRTFQRFREAGFHVGLHFLGPSIYPPDAYLTPVPDPRLVKDAFATLAADIDAQTAVIPTAAAPDAFPAEDGGYTGDGAVLQIGNELILYGGRSVETPFGFQSCQRGLLGTEAAPHAKGEPLAHVKKSYGYFLFDMDTTLLDEVSTNFAKVANACDVDMIYFDGSERLQGDHWYYNAKLHQAFFEKLERKDILLQASSFSHYSWHILARSASADGHGDLKGYLDERSGWLDSFKRNAMPLDIGWYYGYDPNSTLDEYEYVLGATIGYDSSMSFQVSLDAARKHPFTGNILDLIARYERLRLSGRVPDDMRARLRIDPALAGEKTPEERAALLDVRREYRLVGEEGHEAFQRIMYPLWHNVTPADAASSAWSVEVKQAPAAVGIEIHMQPGPWLAPGPAYYAPDAVALETFDDLAPYLRDPQGRHDVTGIRQGEGGATLDGVTQLFMTCDGGTTYFVDPDGTTPGGLRHTPPEMEPREGPRYAIYFAESRLGTDTGWSMVGKQFDPPLDLSWHKAIGFWLHGDGKGGQFKLQLTDGTKAVDYYVPNNYTEWRYQQLPRPATDPIDYSKVRRLNFYYNGLPAQSGVVCAIDDVKALRAVDTRVLTDPWVEVGGKRFAWTGSLSEGQYVLLRPGEPWRRYGLPLTEPEVGTEPVETLALFEGTYPVQFGCAGTLLGPIRVRVTLDLPERYEIPACGG